jgi:hypothetical protein
MHSIVRVPVVQKYSFAGFVLRYRTSTGNLQRTDGRLRVTSTGIFYYLQVLGKKKCERLEKLYISYSVTLNRERTINNVSVLVLVQ